MQTCVPGIGILAAIALAASSAAQPVFVDSAAIGNNDGTSWANAYLDLQSALSDGTTRAIWVKAGVYRPGNPGEQSARFSISQRTLYGGFAGNESNLAQRNTLANVTILSADLVGDDGPDFSNRADNSPVLVDLDSASLDGVFLRGATDHAVIMAGITRVVSCIFHENSGACVASDLSAPPAFLNAVDNCRFLRNGGKAIDVESRAQIRNCEFQRNGLLTGEPAVAIRPRRSVNTSQSNVINCNFLDNPGGALHAGGAASDSHAVYLTNSILLGNGGNPFSGVVRRHAAWCVIDHWLSHDLTNATFFAVLDVDPRFYDADGDDGVPATLDDNLRLAPDSPCIDAGNSTYVSPGRDIEGTPRILHCRPDIGAFENWAYLRDCDQNGVADACEIRDDPDLDSDRNNVLDKCDWWYADCDDNNVPDRCQVGEDDDADGVLNECEGMVRPLTLIAPADASIAALTGEGAYVLFAMPSASGGYGEVSVNADVASGSLLPIGTTSITATATDQAGSTVTATFRVTVNAPPDTGNGSNGEDNAGDGDVSGDDESEGAPWLPCALFPVITLTIAFRLVLVQNRGSVQAGRRNQSASFWLLLIASALAGSSLIPAERAIATDCNGNGIPDETEWTPPSGSGLHVYVNAAATGADTGASWQDAHTSLHAGICTAQRLRAQIPNSPIVRISIAAGVYRPSGAAEGYDRTRSFIFPHAVHLQGSYSLSDAGEWVQDVERTPTILDGDLLGDDAAGFVNYADNSECVVRFPENRSVTLDRVHIRGGNAPASGGGLSGVGDIRLTYCRVYENRAQHSGGAVSVTSHVSRLFAQATLFRQNEAPAGSAIHMSDRATLWVTTCIVAGNGAFTGGAAIEQSANAGGADIAGCTVVGNIGGAYRSNSSSSSSINTSILWRNGTTPVTAQSVRYSLIPGGHAGAGNIDADPAFANEDGPDGLIGTADDDYHLTASSPCVNTGRYSYRFTDYDGDLEQRECAYDMGALESAFAPDCDGDGRGDQCQAEADWRVDIDRNTVPDICQPCIFTDCNRNGLGDKWELDIDGDGLIDECDDFPNDPTLSFRVPISLGCPPDLSVVAQSSRGAVVAIMLPAAGGGIGAVMVTSDAPADGVFPVGTTAVTIRARDEVGSETNCRMYITVEPPRGL